MIQKHTISTLYIIRKSRAITNNTILNDYTLIVLLVHASNQLSIAIIESVEEL
jgi:hypothetical protein